jgi:hypothetical protein
MVAADLAFRNDLLSSLVRVLYVHFELEVPDILPDVLLHFNPE